jgi:hypothetical protein
MTIDYQQTEPVNVTINVRTESFDSSVSHCNTSIDVLTGAVVTMNAAQCAAIEQTGKEVSKHVIDGFFGTIRTELSQQIQALDSAIKAGFGLIFEQGKAVSAQKNVMETDFNRISSRYATLFQDLDDECRKRVYALDKQSFTLSEKVQKQLVSEATSNAAATNLMAMQEGPASRAMLLVSGLNRKCCEILKTLAAYITQETRLTSLINSFMEDEEAEDKQDLFVPVIFAESGAIGGDAVRGNARQTDTRRSSTVESFVPGFINATEKNAIAEAVNNFGTTTTAWSEMPEKEKNLLNKEFNAICESYFSNNTGENGNRVYETLMGLWRKSNVSSLKRQS